MSNSKRKFTTCYSISSAKELLAKHKYSTGCEPIHIQFPCNQQLIDFLMQNYAPNIDQHYDVYFDDRNFTLLANNFLIRFRDQRDFTLTHKIKPGIEENALNEIFRFCEEKDANKIKDLIGNILVSDPDANKKKTIMDLKISRMATRAYAFIPFVRYEFNTEKFGTIYLDETKILEDNYYVVGTIKINTEEDAKAAVNFLNEHIDINTGPACSKVMEWLYYRQRSRYDTLMKLQIEHEGGIEGAGHFNSPPIGLNDNWLQNYVAILRDQDTDFHH